MESSGAGRERLPVLLAAGGEPWEAGAMTALAADRVVVLKRCVDLPDLLATAASGIAEVAVVAGELRGLDADAVVGLLRHDVRCVALGGDADALTRLGVVAVLDPADLDRLPEVVRGAGAHELVVDPDPTTQALAEPARGRRGRLVAVHGPPGAPGRTTLAAALASLHARGGSPCVLVDADPQGGTIAQHLGVLDEASGLLAASRLVNAGALDPASFARCRRALPGGLELLTGLPRPDRWVEVRAGVLEAVLDAAAEVGDVVVDTGPCLEDDADVGRVLARHQLTLDAVAVADEVVVVGSAEPSGLTRLARTLVDLRDTTSSPVRVVVNRMRDSLGWGRRDVVGMVEGYVRPLGVHFVPEDRAVVDRALVAGTSVADVADGPLRKALAAVHEGALGAPQKPPISR